MPTIPKKAPGRRRIWADNAERQRAYRRRLEAKSTTPVTELGMIHETKSVTLLSVIVAYDAGKSILHGAYLSYEAAKKALEEERLKRNGKAKRDVGWSETNGEKGEWGLIYSSNPIYLKRQTIQP